MSLYSKILVPLDCSFVDPGVVDHVKELALQNSAEIVLLHVVHSHTLDQHHALKCCADNDLEQYYEDLQTAGINVEILLKSGEPEKEILKELKAKKYDLVVMGIHGHSFLGSLIFGSVSRKVRSKSDVPLLLLKIKK